MVKNEVNKNKKYAKAVLIISCVFAVISSILLVLMASDLPQVLKGRIATKYLYENGVEVEAHIKSYYYRKRTLHGSVSVRYRIKYEYIDENNNSYVDEYLDTVVCRTQAEKDEREQYIKQMISDGATRKMLIADNGCCCLSVYKESLIGYKTLAISISVIVISAVVLGLCIFGIVRQAKNLKR